MKISTVSLSLSLLLGMTCFPLTAHAQVMKPTASTPTPIKSPTPSLQISSEQLNGASSYPVGQCTWGAKVLAPWAGTYWGNGGQWAQSAQAMGFQVSDLPTVGSIACWQDGGYGHVAVVTHVESPQRIQVQEANYNHQEYIANFRGWFDPTASYWGTVSYIYPLG